MPTASYLVDGPPRVRLHMKSQTAVSIFGTASHTLLSECSRTHQQACLCPCGQASASQSAPSRPSPGGTQSSRPHVICGPITRTKPGAAALQCVMPPPSPPAGSPHLLLHHRRPAGWEMFPGSEKNMWVSPGADTPALQRAQ